MNKKAPLENNNPQSSIDIKSYIFKVISYWKLFVVTITIGFISAKFINGYKPKIYSLDTTISVKEENNPLFSTGTNIAFNWGGESNSLGTVKVILRSRTHNEKVVDSLQFYINYFKEGRYRLKDSYGKTPFEIKLQLDKPQVYSKLIKIEAVSKKRVRVSFDFNESNVNRLITYPSDIEKDKTGELFSSYVSSNKNFIQEFDLNQEINLPFLNFTIKGLRDLSKGESYYVSFRGFNSTVGAYRGMRISSVAKGTSIIRLQMTGANKQRILAYLNTSIKVLEKDKKKQKVAYAQNTKKYIDDLFVKESDSLKSLETALSIYKTKNNIYNLSEQGSKVFSEISELDLHKREITNNIESLDNLKNYVLTHKKYTSIPVPAIIQIADGKIPAEVGSLISKSTIRETFRGVYTDNHPEVIALDKEISTIKKVLFENIKNLKAILNNDLSKINKRFKNILEKQKIVPQKEQGLINLQRNYGVSEANYNHLKQKSYEAGTAIAANVSDVKIIDTAKDLGQGPIYPIPSFNFMVAFMLSMILPLFYIIIRELLDNKIHSVEDIEKKYAIPVLGVIGRNNWKNNLAVFERPKSSVAESFRALRSNVHFLFNTYKDSKSKSKTLILTSSVSGEGKTMISINMATAFALGGKKTILLGLDLRKPEIHSDFELNNDKGVVNYLIGEESIEGIINTTKIPNLDLIISGPIPPNPSELLLSDNADKLIRHLKDTYDYIIIDTPPVGLVSDTLELFKYSDAIIYVIRQDYSEKGMMKMIDDKYRNKEVKNISYVLNDFTIQNKYGYYSYGYYGHSTGHANGYHDDEKEETFFSKIFGLIKPKQ